MIKIAVAWCNRGITINHRRFNMNLRKLFALLLTGSALCIALTGCEDEPAEELGDAVEKAGDNIEEAADEVTN